MAKRTRRSPHRATLDEFSSERWPVDSDLDVFAALETSELGQWQFNSRVSSHQYLRLYELARRYVDPGATVLDWGTGEGHFAYWLKRSGYSVTAYALVEETVPDAVKDSLVVGSPTDPVTLPFEDGTFDAVASVGVLEHVRETGGDELSSLREISRVLQSGGTFLCFHFPNRYSWIDLAARALHAPHHTYRYTPADISDLVKAAEMRLLETQRYAFLPRLPLSRLPRRTRWSEKFAVRYDHADDVLGRLFPWVCTNHYFVART
jgi:SAM-dependent methyltransferase